MPLGLLGKKLGSTRVYNASGVLIPVTVVLAGPNRVLQVKAQAGKDGYNAVQLGFGSQKPQRIAKPALGHLVKHGALDKAAADKARDKGDKTALVGVMKIKEFRNFSKDVKPGDLVGPALFAPGDFVDAIGVTKGRGFEGVMKRHNFGGGPSTHGHKGWHRRGGAIGQRLFPGTVLRGFKMPGHMGQVQPHHAEPRSHPGARGGQFAAHQGRDPRSGRRLRRHPRIQETSEGLEAAGERRADEAQGRRREEGGSQTR